MISVCSNVQEIADLEFAELAAGRVYRASKVVRVDGRLVVLLADGRVFCDALRSNRAYMPGMWPWTVSLMKALRKMLIISQAAVDEHIRFCRGRAEREKLEHDVELYEELVRKYGPRLSRLKQTIAAKEAGDVADKY